MKTIWKWTLAVTDQQFVDMPQDAEPLSVQMQGGLPQLWALCSPDKAKVGRSIRIIGTGHPITDDPGSHIGTFQMHDGGLVFHVFWKPS